MKTIGIVGTGIMASGMAQNYLKAGYSVYIWNRTKQKTVDLQSAGAKLLSSPRAVAEQADIVFEVTATDESSQSVWQGESGILAGADKSSILITSATLTADWTDTLAAICEKQGKTFFDMPLTGGRVAAEGGNLTLLVGGNESKLHELKPALAPISSKAFYFGKAGSGMRYKLSLNVLQAIHLIGFAEVMQLASQQGLQPDAVGPALVDRPGGVMTTIGWNAYQQSAIPLTFSVDWVTKDLGYAKKMAGTAPVPLLDTVLEAYRSLQTAGYGAEDFACAVKAH